VTMTEAKRRAGERAAEFVQDGMTVGLGTGSTVFFTLQRLGDRVRDGLRIRGIPTSEATAQLARQFGIPLTTFADVAELDLAIDGADEVSPDLHLIKGGGGALLREKLVATAARRLIIVADVSKRAPVLGAFPLPVEVVPFAHAGTARRISAATGCTPALRRRHEGGAPFITDNGNYIYDLPPGPIADPPGLHRHLKLLPGVIETGLFIGMAERVIFGSPSGVEIVSLI
jgi:ribose 5-phosphate isomerase A